MQLTIVKITYHKEHNAVRFFGVSDKQYWELEELYSKKSVNGQKLENIIDGQTLEYVGEAEISNETLNDEGYYREIC